MTLRPYDSNVGALVSGEMPCSCLGDAVTSSSSPSISGHSPSPSISGHSSCTPTPVSSLQSVHNSVGSVRTSFALLCSLPFGVTNFEAILRQCRARFHGQCHSWMDLQGFNGAQSVVGPAIFVVLGVSMLLRVSGSLSVALGVVTYRQ